PKGSVFGFLGPSGSGKSTTQKILFGVLKDYQGSVKIMNKETRNNTRSMYESIGVAFEFPNFYSRFSALENLSFFRTLYTGSTEDPRNLLTMVGLEKDMNKKVENFSKGMKMRLNFCRAFLNKPEVIFLDEPTSGLDPVNAKLVKSLIMEQKSLGRTIFITTHNMTVADEICDTVAFLIDGKIAALDTPYNLKVARSSKTVCIEYIENNLLQKKEFPLQDIGINEEFLCILRKVPIQTIHSHEATLEDIFIEKTGRNLL
ncbi:MAG TPA: ABC transporter ATP-binding protein, partial [Chitinispirillaceae bacterium]|nr:ABC transporter ATP-binding protein [Chitinispirillaceae bacterium]